MVHTYHVTMAKGAVVLYVYTYMYYGYADMVHTYHVTMIKVLLLISLFSPDIIYICLHIIRIYIRVYICTYVYIYMYYII